MAQKLGLEEISPLFRIKMFHWIVLSQVFRMDRATRKQYSETGVVSNTNIHAIVTKRQLIAIYYELFL